MTREHVLVNHPGVAIVIRGPPSNLNAIVDLIEARHGVEVVYVLRSREKIVVKEESW